MLEVAVGNKDEVENAQWWYPPAETVDASGVITRETGELGDTWRREGSWGVTDPDLDSVWSG